MISVVEQCINWNKARYARVYDNELTIALLVEENQELQDSETLVDILDACGDITFVAIGALWKLGFNKKEIESLILNSQLEYKADWEVTHTILAAAEDLLGCTRLYLSDNKAALQDKVGYILGYILGVIRQLSLIGLQHEFIAIFKAIADSNDTKRLETNVPSSIKANTNKGPAYITPTENLIKILERNGKNYAI